MFVLQMALTPPAPPLYYPLCPFDSCCFTNDPPSCCFTRVCRGAAWFVGPPLLYLFVLFLFGGPVARSIGCTADGRAPAPDDRLFDVSFVTRCFKKGPLRRVQGAVIGGDRLIGVCHISSGELRALGSSTVPADLKIRDPRWVEGRKTREFSSKLSQEDRQRDRRRGEVGRACLQEDGQSDVSTASLPLH